MMSRLVPSQSSQGRCIDKDAGIGPAGQSATYTAFELVLGTIAEKGENSLLQSQHCILKKREKGIWIRANFLIILKGKLRWRYRKNKEIILF